MPAIAAQCRHVVGVQHNGKLTIAVITFADKIIDVGQNTFGAFACLLDDCENAERRSSRSIGVTEPFAARLASRESGTSALRHTHSPRLPEPSTNSRIADQAVRSVPVPFSRENAEDILHGPPLIRQQTSAVDRRLLDWILDQPPLAGADMLDRIAKRRYPLGVEPASLQRPLTAQCALARPLP